jgi:hypothetical protein
MQNAFTITPRSLHCTEFAFLFGVDLVQGFSNFQVPGILAFNLTCGSYLNLSQMRFPVTRQIQIPQFETGLRMYMTNIIGANDQEVKAIFQQTFQNSELLGEMNNLYELCRQQEVERPLNPFKLKAN